MFCHRRDDGHQVRLARPIVPYDEQRLVVRWLFELKVGENEGCQALGHLFGDDIGCHELLGTLRSARCSQLDHRFYGLELHQIR
ncbi:MAG: hypothetical protein JW395_1896 [Nitrospira sp.]|nr:hypothetical protein [Nitrospira sp.]